MNRVEEAYEDDWMDWGEIFDEEEFLEFPEEQDRPHGFYFHTSDTILIELEVASRDQQKLNIMKRIFHYCSTEEVKRAIEELSRVYRAGKELLEYQHKDQ